MTAVIKHRSTHSARLERYLGTEQVERISAAMKGWYGPPILVDNVPGQGGIYAGRNGDFHGRIDGGFFGNLWEQTESRAKNLLKKLAKAPNARGVDGKLYAHAGFSSLSDLIAEATAGKRREFIFQKTGVAGTVGAASGLFRVAGSPLAGAVAAAAPGGTPCTDATQGGIPFVNPASGDTQHFVSASVLASLPNTLLMVDRLFAVAKTMNSTATEAVTGVGTRYQNTVAGSVDSAEGNFVSNEVGTVLPATAHNWTACNYLDQGGVASVFPSVAGRSAAVAGTNDLPLNTWFIPLEAGDSGVKALTQMQCDALVATGTIDFVLQHPLAWMACPLANILSMIDGINSAFNLVRIFDDACLSFIEIAKPAVTATNYLGSVTTVAG